MWLCFFLYLLLAAVVYSIFNLFISNEALLLLEGKILFIMAIGTSSYGIIHANKIKIKNISVSIYHIPESWKKRKVVFISDIHLGHILGASFAEKITKMILDINPDILLVGGDVYDGAKGDPFALVASFKKIMPALGKYFVMGNHEEFSDNTKFKNALEAQDFKVLVNETVTIDGINLVGVDYEATVDPVAFKTVLEIQPIHKDVPSILLKHTPAHLEIAKERGISLSLSGHTHRAQAWPLNLFTHILFKGYDYGQKKLGKMNVYTSSGIGTWGPPIRVGSDSELVVINFVSL